MRLAREWNLLRSEASFWSRRNVCWNERPPAWKEGIETKVENLEDRTAVTVVALPSTWRKLVSAYLSPRPLQFGSWKTTSTCGFVSKLGVPFSPTLARSVLRHVRPSADAFLGDIFWQCNQRFLRLWTNEEDTLCSLLQNRHLCRFLIRLHQDLQGSVRRHCIQYDAEEAEDGSDFSSIHAKLGHASQPSLRFNIC